MPTKIKNRVVRAGRHAKLTAYTMSVFVFVATGIFVSTDFYSVHAAGLSFGFGESQDIVNGMAVSVDRENTDKVVQANVNNADYVVGVAVDKDSSSVVFDNDDEIFVATEGTVGVFVSDVNGDISSGDLVTVSSIGGVVQKQASTNDTQKIVGVAKEDFNADSKGAERVDLKNAGEVSVGLIRIEILVGEPATGQSDGSDNNILVRIGQRAAGRPVTLSQVVITASVILVAFLVSGSLLFGAIKGSFMSIGRNPLSANAIYRGLAQASLVSLGVMMLGIVAGYLVLLI